MTESKFVKTAVKVDLTTEIVKTIARGRCVSFGTFAYIGTAVDIEVKVQTEPCFDHNGDVRQPIFSVAKRVTAAEIYRFGTDQALCQALEWGNHELTRKAGQ